MSKRSLATFETRWRLVDSHWRCIEGNDPILTQNMWLADYLWHYGFNIPEQITYCLAESSYLPETSLKYRVFGGTIHIFINTLIH